MPCGEGADCDAGGDAIENHPDAPDAA